MALRSIFQCLRDNALLLLHLQVGKSSFFTYISHRFASTQGFCFVVYGFFFACQPNQKKKKSKKRKKSLVNGLKEIGLSNLENSPSFNNREGKCCHPLNGWFGSKCHLEWLCLMPNVAPTSPLHSPNARFRCEQT